LNQPTSKTSIEHESAQLRDAREKILQQLDRVVIGMGPIVDLILISIVASGHILFEGVPGMAKTLLVKSLSDLLGCQFSRIQFTPDLLPTDITGSSIYDRNSSTFEMHKGPIFCEILLADEINRAPSKTQSALLEAMQEYQITIEGKTFPLKPPFIVMATQNPVEQEGVYRLPEAQLDRFFMRIIVDYPERADELRILKVHSAPLPTLDPLLNAEQVSSYQQLLHKVQVRDAVYEYVVDLGKATRDHEDILLGASPRALVSLLKAGQARALLRGRDYTTHEDIEVMVNSVLNHRLILRPEVEIEGRSSADVLSEIVSKQKVFQER
jgi:MoxR-like ATPase